MLLFWKVLNKLSIMIKMTWPYRIYSCHLGLLYWNINTFAVKQCIIAWQECVFHDTEYRLSKLSCEGSLVVPFMMKSLAALLQPLMGHVRPLDEVVMVVAALPQPLIGRVRPLGEVVMVVAALPQAPLVK